MSGRGSERRVEYDILTLPKNKTHLGSYFSITKS